MQDTGSPTESAINQLFGVNLHTRLTCEESGETIEVSILDQIVEASLPLSLLHIPATDNVRALNIYAMWLTGGQHFVHHQMQH